MSPSKRLFIALSFIEEADAISDKLAAMRKAAAEKSAAEAKKKAEENEKQAAAIRARLAAQGKGHLVRKHSLAPAQMHTTHKQAHHH